MFKREIDRFLTLLERVAVAMERIAAAAEKQNADDERREAIILGLREANDEIEQGRRPTVIH